MYSLIQVICLCYLNYEFKICNEIIFRLSGSITHEIVRPQLKTAIQSKDKMMLDVTIKESLSAGLPGLDADIHDARGALFKLEGGKEG